MRRIRIQNPIMTDSKLKDGNSSAEILPFFRQLLLLATSLFFTTATTAPTTNAAAATTATTKEEYNYYPDYSIPWDDGICIDILPIPSGRPTYSSMRECCNGAYVSQMSDACINYAPPTAAPTYISMAPPSMAPTVNNITAGPSAAVAGTAATAAVASGGMALFAARKYVKMLNPFGEKENNTGHTAFTEDEEEGGGGFEDAMMEKVNEKIEETMENTAAAADEKVRGKEKTTSSGYKFTEDGGGFKRTPTNKPVHPNEKSSSIIGMQSSSARLPIAAAGRTYIIINTATDKTVQLGKPAIEPPAWNYWSKIKKETSNNRKRSEEQLVVLESPARSTTSRKKTTSVKNHYSTKPAEEPPALNWRSTIDVSSLQNKNKNKSTTRQNDYYYRSSSCESRNTTTTNNNPTRRHSTGEFVSNVAIPAPRRYSHQRDSTTNYNDKDIAAVSRPSVRRYSGETKMNSKGHHRSFASSGSTLMRVCEPNNNM